MGAANGVTPLSIPVRDVQGIEAPGYLHGRLVVTVPDKNHVEQRWAHWSASVVYIDGDNMLLVDPEEL